MIKTGFLIFLLMLPAVSSISFGLTLKKGEVLGPDGQTHLGASPVQLDRLVTKAKQTDEAAGVIGQNVFIVVEDGVVFIPVSDLAGRKKDAVERRITASVVARVVRNSTSIELDVDDLAAAIKMADGDVETAVSRLIENLSRDAGSTLPGLSNEVMNAAENRLDLTAQANARLAGSDVNLEAAVTSWAELSDAEKQSLVDEANATGLLGCSNCSIADAEEFVKEITQTSTDTSMPRLTSAQQALATLSESGTKAAVQKVHDELSRAVTESLNDRIERVIGVAVEAANSAGEDIDQAIAEWDSMSDTEKQALLDRLNQSGFLNCTSCTVQDAEAYANSLR